MRTVLVVVACLSVVYGFCEESTRHGSDDPLDSSKTEHYEDGEHDDDYDHKAILGSDSAVDEFSELSPEEAKSRLSAFIEKMDSNKDGVIETDELVKWIKSSFLKMNVEETQDRMAEDDTNSDGQITWAEYLQAIYALAEDELEAYKKSEFDDAEALKEFEKSFKHGKARFAAADVNGDSQLNEEEYAAFSYPTDYPHMTGVEGDRTIADYDKNDNGKVEEDEYLSHAVFSQKSDEDKKEELVNFHQQDKNGDGALDKEEIVSWLSPNLDVIVEEEATHLFTETDKDKDGRLSKQEILDEYELWVGSEATDYGNLLLDRDEL